MTDWLGGLGRCRSRGSTANHRRKGRSRRSAHSGKAAGRGDALERSSDGEVSGLTQNAIVCVWLAIGLEPHRQERRKLSTDLLFVEKGRDFVELNLSPTEAARAMARCEDGKSRFRRWIAVRLSCRGFVPCDRRAVVSFSRGEIVSSLRPSQCPSKYPRSLVLGGFGRLCGIELDLLVARLGNPVGRSLREI